MHLLLDAISDALMLVVPLGLVMAVVPFFVMWTEHIEKKQLEKRRRNAQ